MRSEIPQLIKFEVNKISPVLTTDYHWKASVTQGQDPLSLCWSTGHWFLTSCPAKQGRDVSEESNRYLNIEHIK